MELKSGSMESLQYAAGSLKADSVVKSGAPAPRSKDELAAKKVAREFEGLFVGMMLKSMRDTVGKDSITGGGQGEEMFHSMLDQEYARIITEHGGIGMSTMLDKQLAPHVASSRASRSGAGNDGRYPSELTGVTHENNK